MPHNRLQHHQNTTPTQMPSSSTRAYHPLYAACQAGTSDKSRYHPGGARAVERRGLNPSSRCSRNGHRSTRKRFREVCVLMVRPRTLNPEPQGGPKHPPRPPRWPRGGPKMAPTLPKVLPLHPQDGISVAQDTPTANNTQHTSHIPGPAECAVAIEYGGPPASAGRRWPCWTLQVVADKKEGDRKLEEFARKNSNNCRC